MFAIPGTQNPIIKFNRVFLMHELNQEFIKQIEGEDWAYLAKMAISFKLEFETNCSELKKLKKRLGVVKHIVHEHLKDPEYAQAFANTSMFIGLVKTIDDFEAIAERNKMESIEFVVFLKALIQKIKRQKIYALKPLERKVEFKKMKDLIENGLGKTL